MGGGTIRLFVLAAAGAAIAASPTPDVPPGCRLDDASTSQLRFYECQEKLRIAAEASTRLSAIQQSGRLAGLRVEGGAVLVEKAGGQPFQIVTAQAVTEAREGRIAVETTQAGTAVFVREGGATVSREGGSVALRKGEGVDVAAPPAPPPPSSAAPAPQRERSGAPRSLPRVNALEAKTWGAARAGGLMARLGER